VRTKTWYTNINGDRWKLQVVTGYQGQEDWSAFTAPKERRILFLREELDLPTVIHELFHAYHSYLHLKSSDIGHKDHEEIMAEFFGDRGEELLKHARSIWRKIK
jgi:hypothetical protein